MLVILSLTSILLLLVTACGGTPSTTTAAGATTMTGGGATTAPGTAYSVSIEGFAFVPATITIPAGSTVTWTNNDTPGHNIKSDEFSSPLMAKGETFQHKFAKAGTYNYICGVHPSMKGVVIVQ